MLLSLAWKNVWRNKKRSLIVVVAIAFGLWGGLLSGAVMMGMGESMVNTAIDRDLSHIQIHHKNYIKDKEIVHYISEIGEVTTELSEIEGIAAYSLRTLVMGMASSPASSYGVRIAGIDPDQADDVTTLNEYILEGNYFGSERRNPIIVGRKLARRLDLNLRSKVVLSFQGLDESIIYMACKVVGIFKTESSQFDERNVYLLQKDLFRILDSEPIYHEIAIRARTSDEVGKIQEDLSQRFPNLDIQTWKQLAPELAFLAQYMKSFTILFVVIILLALVFGITNTMLMDVMERFRELGILISVGMKKIKVFVMILLETVMLSLTGGIIGILIGGGTIYYLSLEGIDLSAIATSLESFGASTLLYPFLPATMYFTLTVLVILAGVFSAMYPAWKAVHLKPAEAVRIY
jgi:ABC-type lipoprotein release transport system permease subunit